MAKHIEKMKSILEKLTLDGILIKSKTNKKYLDTLTGSGVLVLITKEKGYLILDGRYKDEALDKEKDFEIIENTEAKSGKSHFEVVTMLLGEKKKLGLEEDAFSIKDYKKLEKEGFFISLISEEVHKGRIIKEKDEIDILREGCIKTDEIFKEVLKHIKEGISENEINAWIHFYALKKGASKLSFEPVVTSGERTALPHGRPTDRKVKNGEGIMIDFGIEYKNYQTDMTRMVFVGKPNEELNKIYDVVKKAQEMGVKNIKKGAKALEVDKIVRDFIEKEGYGKYYNHGLGHGIGIGDGVEYPFLNQKSEVILEEGMIMSCEPGIYIKGLGGVRIEDDVLIENEVGIPLNKWTKNMIII
ncbi:MAG: M24 family metallopeptidase [Clostridium sp.]